MDLPAVMDRSGLRPRVCLRSVARDRWLGSRPSGGGLFSADRPREWELWEIEKSPHGGVFLNSEKHRTRLACNDAGNVYTAPMKKHAGTWETWTVTVSPHGGVFITSLPHDKRLACDSEGRVHSVHPKRLQVRGRIGEEAATWELSDILPTVFVSSAAHNKRLSSEPVGRSLSASDNRHGWERWVLEPAPHGGFFLHSPAHEMRLALGSERNLYIIGGEDHRGGWETFRLSPSPHGDKAYFLDSVGHEGKRLACNERGHVYVVDSSGHAGGWESWTLEPSPHCGVVEKTTTWKRVLGGVALGAVAGPLAVVGLVSLFGFGAAGIASESLGAAMMSASASASGGGVAAGGVVATLQAIGASGLGIAGTTAASLSGAAIGGGVAGGLRPPAEGV